MILVTGGTGLLGTYVLLQLSRQKNPVRVLVRKNTPRHEVYNLFKLYEPLRYEELYNILEWVEGDILDLASLEVALTGISEIYHIAGKVSFNEKDKRELYRVNVEGTRNMVNLAIEHKINKFCFISSIAALDPQIDKEYIDEEAEWNLKNMHSSYAISKYAAEMEVWRASQEGLDVIIVNPGIILGSGNWERSSGMLYDLNLGKHSFYPSGITGYIDAEDVANICIKLMESNEVNQKYILISENMPYKEVMQTIRNYFQKSPAKRIPDSMLSKIAFISRCLPFKKQISKAVVLGLTGTHLYSNEKIKNIVQHSFIPVKDSLQKHAKNYLQYKNITND